MALPRATLADYLNKPTTKRGREHHRRLITVDWMGASLREYERAAIRFMPGKRIWRLERARVPVPESVLKYFDSVGARVSVLARREVPRKNGVAKAVASAVGLECRGRHNPFDPFNGCWRQGHETLIAWRVYSRCADNWSNRQERDVVGDDWKTICEAGAQRHNTNCECGRRIGWTTADRYFRQHAKSVVPSHVQQRFRFLRKPAMPETESRSRDRAAVTSATSRRSSSQKVPDILR